MNNVVNLHGAEESAQQQQVQSGPIGCNLPAIGTCSLSEDFGDPETLLNSRDWLEKVVMAHGATVDGGGCGMGAADIDITLEGMRYNIKIRPLGVPK